MTDFVIVLECTSDRITLELGRNVVDFSLHPSITTTSNENSISFILFNLFRRQRLVLETNNLMRNAFNVVCMRQFGRKRGIDAVGNVVLAFRISIPRTQLPLTADEEWNRLPFAFCEWTKNRNKLNRKIKLNRMTKIRANIRMHFVPNSEKQNKNLSNRNSDNNCDYASSAWITKHL